MARLPTIHRRRQWPPSWHHEAPRSRASTQVLVEHPDPKMRDLLARGLEQHGYRAITCAGPGGDDRRGRCPLLADEPCPAVSGADAIVFGLDRGESVNRRVLERLRELHDPRTILPVSHPHAMLPAELTASQHTVNRTVIAPLVRHLHEALEPTASPG